MWPDEVRALASRTVAPTLYDLGESIEEWAAGVLDLAGPGPLAVVGNSVGGSCALPLASASLPTGCVSRWPAPVTTFRWSGRRSWRPSRRGDRTVQPAT